MKNDLEQTLVDPGGAYPNFTYLDNSRDNGPKRPLSTTNDALNSEAPESGSIVLRYWAGRTS